MTSIVSGVFEAGHLHFLNAIEPLQVPGSFARYLAPLRHAEWVVYAKPPFGGPRHVLKSLDCYTHRVAIANRRLIVIASNSMRAFPEDVPGKALGLLTAIQPSQRRGALPLFCITGR